MKLSYAVCGVMTTASFDDGFDAIATSSEITSHTILDARQCQERRNTDGLFLRNDQQSEGWAARPPWHGNTVLRITTMPQKPDVVPSLAPGRARNGTKQLGSFCMKNEQGGGRAAQRCDSCLESPQ